LDAQIKTEEEKKYVEEKKDEELLVSAFNTFYDKVYSYFFIIFITVNKLRI
jgi:hypothetical protein